jgi:prolipoprotein diacylglyceryltransferase
MFPVLQIGPAAVRLSGLLLIAGVWAASWLAERAARRGGMQTEAIQRLLLIGLVAGVVGARLGHALRYPTAYATDPLALLALTPVTLELDAGVAAGLIAALVYGQGQKLSLWPTLDALAPAMAGFAVFLALAHMASGDAFGAPTDLPWAIELWGARRHPAQIYELLAAVGILVLLLRMPAEGNHPGVAFGEFVALSAGARLVLEAFRGDSVLWFGQLRSAQVVSLLVLLGALALVRRLAQRSPQPAA